MQEEQALLQARDHYARHASIEVSESLLDDLIELYASETLSDDDEIEAFVERMAEDDYKAAIRLDFCHCAMAVNAALLLPEEAVYRCFVGLLDLGEEDEVLAKMKRFVLRKLAEDALEAVEDEARFEQRVVFAVSAV